jgi:hypothetical protein
MPQWMAYLHEGKANTNFLHDRYPGNAVRLTPNTKVALHLS